MKTSALFSQYSVHFPSICPLLLCQINPKIFNRKIHLLSIYFWSNTIDINSEQNT